MAKPKPIKPINPVTPIKAPAQMDAVPKKVKPIVTKLGGVAPVTPIKVAPSPPPVKQPPVQITPQRRQPPTQDEINKFKAGQKFKMPKPMAPAPVKPPIKVAPVKPVKTTRFKPGKW